MGFLQGEFLSSIFVNQELHSLRLGIALSLGSKKVDELIFGARSREAAFFEERCLTPGQSEGLE